MRLSLCAAGWLAALPLSANVPLVDAGRRQVGVTTTYDPTYRRLPYPNGDIPATTGVCSDVVVRAFRTAHRVDLQKEVHVDMQAAFAAYPKKWGLSRPDANIDHRRVPNLMTFFQRRGWAVGPGRTARDFAAGDVVAWDLGGGITHIGIVSDRCSPASTPLVIHNIGRGTQEEDVLFAYRIIGHYRPRLDRSP